MAIKVVRLEFQLYWEGDTNECLPGHVWLKVNGNCTEAFGDMKFAQLLPKTNKEISLEVNLLEEVEMIEVVCPGGLTPVQDITMYWTMKMQEPN